MWKLYEIFKGLKIQKRIVLNETIRRDKVCGLFLSSQNRFCIETANFHGFSKQTNSFS